MFANDLYEFRRVAHVATAIVRDEVSVGEGGRVREVRRDVIDRGGIAAGGGCSENDDHQAESKRERH